MPPNGTPGPWVTSTISCDGTMLVSEAAFLLPAGSLAQPAIRHRQAIPTRDIFHVQLAFIIVKMSAALKVHEMDSPPGAF